MCRRPQLRVFCLSAAGTSFTDQEDESRAGEEGREVSGEQETYESRGKLARSELKVCWRCKSNLWWENTVLCFLCLVCSAIKIKPEDKLEI